LTPGPDSFVSLTSPTSPIAAGLPFILVTLLLWVASYVLFGFTIATDPQNSLPRPAGWLFIVGTLVSLAPILIGKVIGAELSALAYVWLGASLLTATARPQATTQPSLA